MQSSQVRLYIFLSPLYNFFHIPHLNIKIIKKFNYQNKKDGKKESKRSFEKLQLYLTEIPKPRCVSLDYTLKSI